MTAPTSAHALMLLTNGFRPDPRVHKEAASLVEHGVAVTILCLDREQDLAPEERLGGIRVLRFRVGRVRAGRIASLAVALWRFYRQAARAAAPLHAARPFDVIHCHDFDTMPLGLHLRRRLRSALVYDVHDLYAAFFGNPLLRHLALRIDRRFYRAADALILVNERFRALPGIDRGKSEVVMNVPTSAGGAAPSPVTDVGLFYAGNLETTRDMRYALPVLRDCGLRAQFAGDGPLLAAYRDDPDADRVTLLGRVSPDEVGERTRDCLAVLALYDVANPNNRLASPNKLFEAMKYGKPAIVSADTVMAEIVERWDCGVAVDYGDPASLRAALMMLRDPAGYDRLCRNAHRAFVEAYNWDGVMAPRLLALYRRLVGADRPDRRAGHPEAR